jgi:cell division protein FtsL
MSAQPDNKTISPLSTGRGHGDYQALAWTYLFSTRMVVVSALLILLLASGISIIYTTFKNRYLLNELQQLRGQRNELQVQWGQLLIEQSTFSLEGRIERKAVDELQMVVPDFSRIVMVDYE